MNFLSFWTIFKFNLIISINYSSVIYVKSILIPNSSNFRWLIIENKLTNVEVSELVPIKFKCNFFKLPNVLIDLIILLIYSVDNWVLASPICKANN